MRLETRPFLDRLLPFWSFGETDHGRGDGGLVDDQDATKDYRANQGHFGAPRHAAVALGGGGARGIAHLGVMRAIQETTIQIDRVVGVSMGAIVGAMVAAEDDVAGASERAMELLLSPGFQLKQDILLGGQPSTQDESSGGVFSWYGRLRGYLSAHRKLTRAVTKRSLLSDSPLIHAIEHLVPDINIQDTRVPLSIVALDLKSGHRMVLENGSLRLAVRASMAIPGIFPPVRWKDSLLCDIGVIESLPTMVAKSLSSDLTIGVDVGQEHAIASECDTALDVMMRFDDVCERLMRRHAIEAANVIVRPMVGEYPWYDFSQPERLIQMGYQAGKKTLERFAKRVADQRDLLGHPGNDPQGLSTC